MMGREEKNENDNIARYSHMQAMDEKEAILQEIEEEN